MTDSFRLDDYSNLYSDDTWANISGMNTPVDLTSIPEKSFSVDDEQSNDWERFCSDVYFKFLPFKKEEYSKISYRILKFVTDKPILNMKLENYSDELNLTEKEIMSSQNSMDKYVNFLPEGNAFSEVDLEDDEFKPHAGFIYHFNPKPICGGTLEIRNRGGDIERIKSNPERLIMFDTSIRHSMTNTAMKENNVSQEIKILYSNIWAK